jgi:hypothetical protein
MGVFKNYVYSEHLLKFAPLYYEFILEDKIRYISANLKYSKRLKKKLKIKLKKKE